MADILLLTLKVFSATGGIEKVCRIAGKALHEYAIEHHTTISVLSMHDEQKHAYGNPYFPNEMFIGYGVNKAGFILDAIRRGRKANVVILSHINLLVVGRAIKMLSPSTKVIMFAHGIEVWGSLSRRKTNMLRFCDMMLAVSHFTRDSLIAMHGIEKEKTMVLNNALDPFLPLHKPSEYYLDLRKRYNIPENVYVIFTLTRLSAKEKYKGYDNVVKALAQISCDRDDVFYLIGGSYDEKEKASLDNEIENLGIRGKVFLTGFLPDHELAEHFNLADLYVMPSKKEGFGIVFIEAMYYGLPVIAGNQDGSVDALLNGELGTLVDPDDIQALKLAILAKLNNLEASKPNKEKLIEHFSYEVYKTKINGLLKEMLRQ
ncbi:MAG: glycosyltransferase family 4 protein [Ferruginibacter sp.]|nr:glycosyltransferase family 4 protein [Ferruginibacter sp.]